MIWSKKDWKRLGTAAFYLSPNIFGFMIFVLFPLIFSLIMAFTNWDLKQHNIYKSESVEYIGLQNFILLFKEDNFLRYLMNTFIMMLGLPFGMAGSLISAMLLSSALKGKSKGDAKVVLLMSLAITACMLCGTILLWATGMQTTALSIIIVGFVGTMLISGAAFGSTIYRTIFYLPSFTSGVAIFLLWKKIYNPNNGPLNNFLREPISLFSSWIHSIPPSLVQFGLWVFYLIILIIIAYSFNYLRRSWRDGETGITGCVLGATALCIPAMCSWFWIPSIIQNDKEMITAYGFAATVCLSTGTLCCLGFLIKDMFTGRDFHCVADYGLGTSLMLTFFVMMLAFVLLGIGLWCFYLPGLTNSAIGMEPPNWLTNYDWAKPSLIMMGLWSAIGSNSMLLYLAGLSSVPQSLYEAADIDGAKGFKRFWHITWPQLAPVTFFIFVMAVIGGLQGGFETAKTMTGGGPDGSTTTLAYYIYSEGFETGRLGYASAVAWTMFAIVFSVTMFNWKFGSKYNND